MARLRPHNPDYFYEYPSGAILCGECLDLDLRATAEGRFVDDERVYQGMFRRMKDDQTEAYQCDNCLRQNAAYEEIGEEP